MKHTQEKLSPSEMKAKLKVLREKYREPVKGIFRFYEVPGGTLSFIKGGEYGDERIDRYVLTDGHVCTVPLGVAKHLNKNGWYPVHAYRQEEDGKPSMMIGKKVRRFGFQSLDFIDESDFEDQSNVIISPDSVAN